MDSVLLLVVELPFPDVADLSDGDETTATQMISCLESFFFAFSGYLVTFDQERHQQATDRVRQVSVDVERHMLPNFTSV